MIAHTEHFHFMGIGGIGMSGIASILQQQGYRVSGCDTNTQQDTVHDLTKQGCTIFDHHNSPGCADTSITTLVYIKVYADAIASYHQEIVAAKARNIAVISRAAMLANLMKKHTTVCVSGAHGKTTTSAMIAHLLIAGERDPSVVVGGYIKTVHSNARLGKSSLFVAEADESDRSLLLLPTDIGVVTNIDLEHLETYTDLTDIQNTFKTFLETIRPNGHAIICADDVNSRFLYPLLSIPFTTFGFSPKADIYATDIVLSAQGSSGTIVHKKTDTKTPFQLTIPGAYNILNALAALAACCVLDIPIIQSIAALTSFEGVDQRFCRVGTYQGAAIYEDYGHHPTEIEQVLKVAKNSCSGKTVVLFQPHRYTRTHLLWDQFIKVFLQNPIDHLIITDIYPAFEPPISQVTSKRLVEAVLAINPQLKIDYIPYQYEFTAIKEHLLPILGQNDLLLLLGAGRVNLLKKHII